MNFPSLVRTAVALFACAFLAMAAASCGSASVSSTVAADSGDTDAPEGSAEEAASPQTGDDGGSDEPESNEPASGGDGDDEDVAMAASSPIGAYFADDGGFATAVAEYRVRVEEYIVGCMAAQGFDFAVSPGSRVNPIEVAQNDLSEREWTAEYGYGISTSFTQMATQGANDPNTRIFLSMSPAEQELWSETLFGPGNGLESVGDNAMPLEERGCIGEGIQATNGADALEGLGEFEAAYEEGEAGIYDTNEMIVASGDWVRCMGEAGYSNFTDLDSPEEFFELRVLALSAQMNAAVGEIDPDQLQGFLEGNTVEEADLPGIDLEELRALQDEERETALVDLDCYDTHVRDSFEPLRDAFEKGLMQTYGSELDSLRNIGQ